MVIDMFEMSGAVKKIWIICFFYCCVSGSLHAASEDNIQVNLKVQQQLQKKLITIKQQIDDFDKSKNSNDVLFLQLQAYAYQQHLNALAGILVEQKSKNPSFSAAKKNNEVWASNQLSVDVSALEMEISSIETTQLSIQTQLEDMALAKKRAESSVRQLVEKFAGVNSLHEKDSRLLEESRLKVSAIEANLAAGNAQLKWYELQFKNRHASLAKLKTLLAESSSKPVFSQTALNDIYLDLTRRDELLYKQHDQMNIDQQKNLADFLDATDKSLDMEQQDLLALRLKNSVVISGIISDQLLLNTFERLFWKQQYQFAKKDINARQFEEDLSGWLEGINNLEQHLLEGLEWTRSKKQEWQIAGSVNANEYVQLWQAREQYYLQAQQDVHRVQALFDNLHHKISSENNSAVLGNSYEYLKLKFKSWALSVWNFEITSVDENDVINGETITIHRSVTVEKIAKAFFLLMMGFFITVKISSLVVRVMRRFTNLKALDIAIVRKWILAFIFILLLINSLLIVHIPLSVFAFTGGAVALGLGIGMQTLLKNLVSGIMVQFERPFKPGDFIDINGIQGEVIDMGVRAAVLRSPTGMETVVPNSTFMETNFTNWTMKTPYVRFELTVGVAYGSDATLVRELLLCEVVRHGLVLKNPKPDVLFSDFGNDALQFVVWYWVDMAEPNSPKKIASDLRFMIEKALRQNNITIAFPQRDVHLNMQGPLNVNVSRVEN